MKKILSFVLVLAMIASMMCVSASAFDRQYIVGSSTEGVDPTLFTSNKEFNSGSTVTANVVGEVYNRYAVELAYTVSNITINGNVTWDTVGHAYEIDEQNFSVVGVNTLNSISGDVQVGSCTVVNHSDLSVWVDATVSYQNTNNVTGKVLLNDATGAVSASAGYDLIADDNKVEVMDAYDDTTTGSAKTTTYNIFLNSQNWANVASDLGANSQNVVATYTFIISPAN